MYFMEEGGWGGRRVSLCQPVVARYHNPMKEVKDSVCLQDRVWIVNVSVDKWKLSPSGMQEDSEFEME